MAAKTSQHIYLFETGRNEPLWIYQAPAGGIIGDDVKGGIDISADGGEIFTQIGCRVLFFSKDSATPLASFEIAASLGAADLADDGSFLAVGGTDRTVRILDRVTQSERAAVELNEYVGEIDVSGDSRLVAAGTSGSGYFLSRWENLAARRSAGR